MEIILSILIATMPERRPKFLTLFSNLCLFAKDKPVEILWDDSMDYNIGAKRNMLLNKASGEYIIYHDDDDFSESFYIDKILEAIKMKPDSVAINGVITTNGGDERKWFISKEYGSWFTGADGTYYRTPNHISPVRRELALQAGFPEVSFAEDYEYSMRLLPLLKTESLISTPLYHYDYWKK